MSFIITQGDLRPYLGVTVNIADLVEPLSAAQSIQMHWIKPDGTDSLVTLTPVDLANGVLQYQWASGDTDQQGVHRGRVLVTLSSGVPQSFPTDVWIYWYVTAYV